MGRAVSEARAGVVRDHARRVRAEHASPERHEIDLDALCVAVGVEVVYTDLEGATARVLRVNGRTRITVSNRIDDPGAIRFSIAHELAHIFLQHGILNDQGWVLERLCEHACRVDSEIEREANMWATELLMPESIVRAYCELPGATMLQVRALARACRTSGLASALRLVELTSQPCAIAYCELGRVRWARRSRTFAHWIPKDRALDPSSAAAEYFHGGRIGDYPHVIPADAWLSNRTENGAGLRIAEHAAIVPALGAVFSLLWLPANDSERISSAV